MRSLENLLPAAAAILVTCLFVNVAQASITGSKHDFGTYGWAKGEVCRPCHIPHNAILKDANNNEVGGPIWNHQLSVATYSVYDATATNNQKTVNVDTNSMLCLSCHDGTVALDSFGGGAGTAGTLQGPANLGTDLSNDHPIGDQAIWATPNPSYMVDPALRDAKHIMPLRQMSDGRNAVGCTSCHEPHNRAATANMLWVANNVPGTTVDGRPVNGSVLCMNCHKK